MKILFLAHRIPFPPDKGERIRAYHEIEFLAEKHEIDLFSIASSTKQIENCAQLRPLCRRIALGLLGKTGTMISVARAFAHDEPLSFAFFDCRDLHRQVQYALATEKYDVIFIFCSAMMQYVPNPAPCPTILDFVDSDSAKWAQYAKQSAYPVRWLYNREARCVSRRERDFVARATFSIAVSAKEAEYLSFGHNIVKVIGNGAAAVSEPAKLPPEITALERYILFMGQMNYIPNVDAVKYFVADIWPTIRRRHPTLKFVIAGRNPSGAVRRLARIPGVIVTGAVQDIGVYLCGSEVVVAPFRISQGVHNKILEAVAQGVPVVCSNRAAAGLPERVRALVTVRDAAAEFACAVSSFLDDGALRSAFSKRSECLRGDLRWERVLSPLHMLLRELETAPKLDRASDVRVSRSGLTGELSISCQNRRVSGRELSSDNVSNAMVVDDRQEH